MWTETDLKQHIKEGTPRPVYFLYGEESYLTAYYADKLAMWVTGGSTDNFGLEKFDGQDCEAEAIEAAAETLPFMSERKCVVVRDYDVSKNAAGGERLLGLVADPPESCVLIFWLCALTADVKKNAKWKAFAAAVGKTGAAVEFPRKTAAEAAKMLCAGAKKRGSFLSPAAAELLVTRCGSDLHRLLGELDKLCALSDGGEITETLVRQATAESLEARVFDLSKRILQGDLSGAQGIVRALKEAREKPTAVLSVLSGAYVDLYRVKTALQSGLPATAPGEVFSYRGREFVLRNAARDTARLSVPALRQSLELLAVADQTMKSSPVDKWLLLERTVVELAQARRVG